MEECSWETIHEAAGGGDAEACRELLSSGADPNALDADRFTPLFHAVQSGDIQCCRVLLEGGAEVNKKSGADEWSPLYTAVCYGFPELCRIMLAAGANIYDRTQSGFEPLHGTAEGHSECLRLLLDAGADVTRQELGDFTPTPLQYAVTYGALDVVQMLLDAGDDPNCERGGMSLLELAFDEGEVEVLPVLLDGGADTHRTTPTYPTWPVIMLAAVHEDVSSIHLLIEAGADPYRGTDHWWSTQIIV